VIDLFSLATPQNILQKIGIEHKYPSNYVVIKKNDFGLGIETNPIPTLSAHSMEASAPHFS